MSLFLYHHNSSVCAAKVRVALHEKGLEWDGRLLELQGDQFEPDYLALNPKAVVPTLVHDGKPVIESNVILEYLDDAFPESPLRPGDPYQRALMRELMLRLDEDTAGIHHAISVLTYAVAYRHQMVEAAGGEDPSALEIEMRKSMNAKSMSWLRDVVLNGTRGDSFRTTLLRMDALLADFENRLETAPWLAGDSYSLADIAYTSYLTRLEVIGFHDMWADRPAVADWYDRLKARPSFTEIIDVYRADYLDVLRGRGPEAWPAAARVLADARDPQRRTG